MASVFGIEWDFQDFPPGATDWLWARVRVDPTTPLGTILTSTATIEPIAGDAQPEDNTDSESQVVTGSYDPNDKHVTPEGNIGPDELLTYQVNFQNVGTDTAFTVVIRDTLDPNLDITTLTLGATSHPHTFDIFDRELAWTFDDILLPDSTVNEPESHGFVKFTIYPIPDLQAGETIANRAAVYFDYNLPVITNTVINIIADQGCEEEVPVAPAAVFSLDMLGPMPSCQQVLLRLVVPHQGSAQVYVCDISGRILRTLTEGILPQGPHLLIWDGQDARGQALPGGVYFVRAHFGAQIQARRVVRIR
jgi:uncharacterized repeat protein (TIGR01451 family)